MPIGANADGCVASGARVVRRMSQSGPSLGLSARARRPGAPPFIPSRLGGYICRARPRHPHQCPGHPSQCLTPKHHPLLQPRPPLTPAVSGAHLRANGCITPAFPGSPTRGQKMGKKGDNRWGNRGNPWPGAPGALTYFLVPRRVPTCLSFGVDGTPMTTARTRDRRTRCGTPPVPRAGTATTMAHDSGARSPCFGCRDALTPAPRTPRGARSCWRCWAIEQGPSLSIASTQPETGRSLQQNAVFRNKRLFTGDPQVGLVRRVGRPRRSYTRRGFAQGVGGGHGGRYLARGDPEGC